MTSAAPAGLPQAAQPDPFAATAQAIFIKERSQIIPGSYVANTHKNPDLVVKRDGLPLLGMDRKPFTISQVAPERRWAVLDTGELMSEEPYKAKAKANHLELFELLQSKDPDVVFKGNVDLLPIRDAADYVSWRVDPEDPEKVLQIGFDPNAVGGKAAKLYDREGESVQGSRMDALCQSYADKDGRAKMTGAEVGEVEEHLGVSSGAGGDAITIKLEQLTELHASGLLSQTDYVKAVSQLTGAGATTEPKPVVFLDDKCDAKKEASELADAAVKDVAATKPTPPEREPGATLCGKKGSEFKNPEKGIPAHERRCTECRALNGLEPFEAKRK
jgi:hypothetical protein